MTKCNDMPSRNRVIVGFAMVLLLLPVVYVVGSGPMLGLAIDRASDNPILMESWEIAYAPLFWTAERLSLGEALGDYLMIFAAKRGWGMIVPHDVEAPPRKLIFVE